MMWGWQGWSWWGWLAMSLSMVALWGLIVWGAVAVVRGSGGSWRRPEGRDPEQILAERYATGGMDEEEYHRRLQTLRSARDDVGEPQRLEPTARAGPLGGAARWTCGRATPTRSPFPTPRKPTPDPA